MELYINLSPANWYNALIGLSNDLGSEQATSPEAMAI